jgi:hypothetical protein
MASAKANFGVLAAIYSLLIDLFYHSLYYYCYSFCNLTICKVSVCVIETENHHHGLCKWNFGVLAAIYLLLIDLFNHPLYCYYYCCYYNSFCNLTICIVSVCVIETENHHGLC